MQAQIGGTLADFGGQLMYLSRRHRWNWATSIHSLPASITVPAYDGTATAGNPRNADPLFHGAPLDAGVFSCFDCHQLPTGAAQDVGGRKVRYEN